MKVIRRIAVPLLISHNNILLIFNTISSKKIQGDYLFFYNLTLKISVLGAVGQKLFAAQAINEDEATSRSTYPHFQPCP